MNGYYRIRMVALKWWMVAFDENKQPTPDQDMGPYDTNAQAEAEGKAQGRIDWDREAE